MKLEPNIAKIISFNIINKYISIRQRIYIYVTLLLTLSIINFSLDLKVSKFYFWTWPSLRESRGLNLGLEFIISHGLDLGHAA